MPVSPTPIQYSFGIPSQNSKTRAKTKGIQMGNEEVKLFQFPDDMILYLKDPKNCTKNTIRNYKLI
jgi:hypothetical protein